MEIKKRFPETAGTLAIVFLTDGQENGQKADVGEFKEFLKKQADLNQIDSEIHCIGLSRNHDANFLNSLAQAGSNTGNFIYVDTTGVMSVK